MTIKIRTKEIVKKFIRLTLEQAKKTPADFLILVFLPFVLLIFFYIISHSFREIFNTNVTLKNLGLVLTTNPITKYFFFVLLLFLLIKTVQYIFNIFLNKNISAVDKKSKTDKYFIFLKEIITTFLNVGLLTATTGLFILFISQNANPEKVQKASDFLLSLDWKIFGVYPTFWIHKFNSIPYLEKYLLTSYKVLPYVTSLTLMLLFFRDKVLFKKFLVSFFVVTMISVPIWFFVPAISPIGMYVIDRLQIGVPEKILNKIREFPVSKKFGEEALKAELSYTTQLKKGGFAISSFPSMHVAWAVLILVFTFLLWRPLIIFSLPWALGTSLGSVYIAQHYAVDVLAGVLVALLTLAIVKRLNKKTSSNLGQIKKSNLIKN